ncbi:MAG: histidinol-phosphatase [Pseudomonadota bacterium]
MTGGAAGHALLAIAHHAASAARPATLAHFRAEGLEAENKAGPGGYDPVTAADKAAETAVRACLRQARPHDALLGEEEAAEAGTSGLTWVIDPIDGTRAYVVGAPTWGVLIALNDGTRPVLGVMDQPFTRERFWGDGDTAWQAQGDDPAAEPARRLSVRRDVPLAQARLCTTFPEVGTPQDGAAFARVRDRTLMVRYGLDCTSYCLLAAGCVDLVIEAGLAPYDIQALIPIVEGAGGLVTTWEGEDPQHGGRVVAAATAELHAQALDLLAG